MAETLLGSTVKTENYVCRTCLARHSDLDSIFTIESGYSLNHIVTCVTEIMINLDDGLPEYICQECKNKAIDAFDFKKKAQESEEILRKHKSNNAMDLKEDPKQEIKIEPFQEHCEDSFDYGGDILEEDFSASDDVKNEKSGHNVESFPCDICSTFFSTEKKLEKHMEKSCFKVETLDENNSSYCPLCGTSYGDNKMLTKHMWDNHASLMGPKKRGRPKKGKTMEIINRLSNNGLKIKTVNFKNGCVFCKDKFKTKEELKKHILTHKDNKLYCCLLCKKSYLNMDKFEDHPCLEDSNIKHRDKSDSMSMNAMKSKSLNFLTETTLQSIMLTCDTEKTPLPALCTMCSQVFGSNTDLINHIDIYHPEKSQRCNICSKVFATLKSAAKHRELCETIDRKHECNTCGLKFAYQISLNKHILSSHEGQSVTVKFIDRKLNSEDINENQFQCDHCKKIFIRKDLLEKHTKTHMSDEHGYECDICKKRFSRKDNMKSHKRTHDPRLETKVNTCLCLYCGRSFNNSSNLIVHMRRHTGEKPYKCDFCGKGFPRSSDLQCHRRSHTGEKPCVCKVCGKAFSRSNKLSRHMRIHTGLKPYKCTYCDKAFAQSNDLTLHVRRHTGDKPYICEICGDRFIQGTALQNHRRAHGHFPTTSLNSQASNYEVNGGTTFSSGAASDSGVASTSGGASSNRALSASSGTSVTSPCRQQLINRVVQLEQNLERLKKVSKRRLLKMNTLRQKTKRLKNKNVVDVVPGPNALFKLFKRFVNN